MKYLNNPARFAVLLGQMWEGLSVTLSLFSLTLFFRCRWD